MTPQIALRWRKRHSSRTRHGILLVLIVTGSTSCGTQPSAPTVTKIPLGVVSVIPPVRSSGVAHNAAIAVTFDRGLDPSTVSTTTVFLKVDARRVPVSVSLVDSNRTLVMQPTRELEVRRTHTVRISSTVSSIDGQSLGQDLVWQFTTLGVRPITWLQPTGGAQAGPFVPLQWRGTEASAGVIEYTICVGPDSTDVADGRASVHTTRSAYVIPPIGWEAGATLYWRVSVQNLNTGERAESGMATFEVIESSAPVDSVLLRISDSGTWNGRSRSWRCPTITAGDQQVPVIRFDAKGVGEERPVAGARLMLVPMTTVDQQGLSLWELAKDEIPCRTESQPPFASENMGEGRTTDTGRLIFASPALTSRIQARLLGIAFPNYTIRTQLGSVDFDASLAEGVGIMVYVYRDFAAR